MLLWANDLFRLQLPKLDLCGGGVSDLKFPVYNNFKTVWTSAHLNSNLNPNTLIQKKQWVKNFIVKDNFKLTFRFAKLRHLYLSLWSLNMHRYCYVMTKSLYSVPKPFGSRPNCIFYIFWTISDSWTRTDYNSQNWFEWNRWSGSSCGFFKYTGLYS